MGPQLSKRNTARTAPEESGVIRLNKTVVSFLTRALERNPSVDLGAYLRRHADEYPEKRARQLLRLQHEDGLYWNRCFIAIEGH
jgi:hypothetical protein